MSFDLPGKLQAAGPKRLIYQRRKTAVSALADLACLQSLRLRTASGSYPTGSGSAKHLLSNRRNNSSGISSQL